MTKKPFFNENLVPRQVLYLGGPPPLPATGNVTLGPSAPAMSSTPPPAHSDHDDADYFKGVIQDVQVRTRMFKPLDIK